MKGYIRLALVLAAILAGLAWHYRLFSPEPPLPVLQAWEFNFKDGTQEVSHCTDVDIYGRGTTVVCLGAWGWIDHMWPAESITSYRPVSSGEVGGSTP
jgi:hypothetical protein